MNIAQQHTTNASQRLRSVSPVITPGSCQTRQEARPGVPPLDVPRTWTRSSRADERIAPLTPLVIGGRVRIMGGEKTHLICVSVGL